MYMKLEEAVRRGYALDAGMSWMIDHGEVVVYVDGEEAGNVGSN